MRLILEELAELSANSLIDFNASSELPSKIILRYLRPLECQSMLGIEE